MKTKMTTAGHYKGPVTPKKMFKAVQAEVRRYPSVKGKRGGKKTSDVARQAIEPVFGEMFDRLYRPYVSDRLLRMGFKEVRYTHGKNDFETTDIVYPGTRIEAEDMYLEFRKIFMESIILNFNFDRPNVGRGGFRNYLKRTLTNILIDKLKEIKKVEEAEKYESIPDDSDQELLGYLLRLAKVAYLLTLDSMRKNERQQWRSETIDAIYGRFEDERSVMKRLVDEHVIKGRSNFDNIKSLFRSAWYENWWSMWSKIASGPRVNIVKGKFKGRDKAQKRFAWRAETSKEEIKRFVEDREKGCAKVVGEKRMKDLNASYDTFLLRLVEMEEQSHKEDA